ncbi:MAG: methionine adenosyltransferase domain-containing protein [Candidatus Saccharibacteria bacterium]|nr:methionine adenosyltransferase domain-containing protein [Candidatus Saccharibacteria bacterium]
MTYRTAESVSPKHPDKLCDQISDAILDAYLAEDPDSRVAAEVCGGHGVVFITGEITSKATVDIEKIARRIAGDDIEVHTKIVKQSPEIANGVDTGGAGDQGIMIGYATDETPEMLPLEVVLSRKLNEYIYAKYPYDGKTQVTIAEDGTISSIVASFQNVSKPELEKLVKEFIEENNLKGTPKLSPRDRKLDLSDSSVSEEDNLESSIELHLNPAGDWHQGGFDADTGLTGRKLIVDNYGPSVAIGGGCYSGKDPSKVDRSAAYMARKIAVDYLKNRKAHEVLVRLAYAIGYAEPLEKTVIIDGVPEEIEGYDLTPRGIIKFLDLKRPIYEETARYGHYGHAFPWDKI